MLIEAIVFPFALGIQCSNENEKTAKDSGSCIQLRYKRELAIPDKFTFPMIITKLADRTSSTIFLTFNVNTFTIVIQMLWRS